MGRATQIVERAEMMRRALRTEQATLNANGNMVAAAAIHEYLASASSLSLSRLADIISPIPRPLDEVLQPGENIGS